MPPPMDPDATPLPDLALAEALEALKAPGCCASHRSLLLGMLREDHAIYRGRGASESERLRAFVLAGIVRAGLAESAMPYAMEELQTGMKPAGVAAAARCARLTTVRLDGLVTLLSEAFWRIRAVDEDVDLDHYPALEAATAMTTACGELIGALGNVAGGREALRVIASLCTSQGELEEGEASALRAALAGADDFTAAPFCCARASVEDVDLDLPSGSLSALSRTEFENQDGERSQFWQIAQNRVSLVAFFYTRCDNPDKCSRTISMLSRARKAIEERLPDIDAVVLGITYDPDFDLPARLRRYGSDRGWRFDERNQLLRTTSDFGSLRTAMSLGVGYGAATVNRHRLELLLIDADGHLIEFRVRQLSNEHSIVDALCNHLTASRMAGAARE